MADSNINHTTRQNPSEKSAKRSNQKLKVGKLMSHTLAGALLCTILVPLSPTSASADTGDSSSTLTVKELDSFSHKQIESANETVNTFSSGELISKVAKKIESDRVDRENARIEEARVLAVEVQRLADEAAEAERVAAEVAAKAEAERVAASTRAASGSVAPSADVPSGQGAEGIVAAALSQLGVGQDCTDLVQNSLAAVGLIARRDQGGMSLGTSISQYDRFGTRVSIDALAPGDILIYGNASSGAHVAIYIGNGQAVHGGYGGSTKIAGVSIHIPLTGAIRTS